MSRKDYYSILGVNPRASKAIISAVYKTLMHTHHPDKGGDKKIAASIGEAYNVLSDDAKRNAYDKEMSVPAGDLFGGEYEILEMISDSGLGTTYKARDVSLDTLVCIKHCTTISPQAEELFLNEARLMRDLRHYGIPSIFRVVRGSDGSFALVMSYIPGVTIERVVSKVEKIKAESTAWMMERVLNIIRYMHHSGAVHGDIKPQKILVDIKRHEAFLVGFGLGALKSIRKGVSKGHTPIFSPPEAIGGDVLWPQSDMYSLGMTIIYALSGDLELTEKKKIPTSVPKIFRDFIGKFVKNDIALRPRWESDDLVKEIKEVRISAFGREHSGRE